MKLIIGLFLVLTFNYCSGQPWFSKTYDITGGHEVSKAMTLNGDSIFIRATNVCDTNLCTILGIFSQSENKFLNIQEYEGIQTGLKNVMQNDSFIFLSSEERNLNNYVTISKFDKNSLDFISYRNLRIDSNHYFSYVIGPSIKYYNQLVIGANVLDSLIYINYQGWYNYQEKALLFVLNGDLASDTLLIIPPSSGAFLKIEDMAIGPDSVLYISFYEKYLKQGNPNFFLEIRKVIYGYNRKLQRVFQWIGPDFDVPESISCLDVGEDSTVYFNYKHDFRSYIAALNKNATIKWECALDSNPSAYLYDIRRILIAKNGDILGAGTISSIVDELGESGFIFRIDPNGHLLWKRVFRVNKGMDLIAPPEFPFQSNLEDIIDLPSGDLLATGSVNKYVGHDYPGGPYNYDIWMLRTKQDGCLSPNCSYIQDIVFKDQYIRLVSPRNEWVVDVDTLAGQSSISRYTFDPDSIIIHSKPYYELIYTPSVQGQWEETGRLMREENGKVYELNPINSFETLLYDFNLQTGDTLIAHQDGSVNTRQVIGVGTVKLWDEVIRKTISVSCTSNVSDPDTTTWIEGIGDMERLFWTKTYCGVEDVSTIKRNVRCFLINELAIYSRPGIDDCFITAIEEPIHKILQVYPNPTDDELHFDLANNQFIHSITLYNYLGQKMLTTDLFNINTLDVSSLSKGSYFGVILFQDGTSRLFKCIIQ